MKRLFTTAAVYMVLGLASGVFYREYTKLTGNLGEPSQLSTLHTHLLVLGMLMFLAVLALEATLHVSGRRSFTVFYWTYNLGLVITIVMMVVRGVLTLDGADPTQTTAAIPGIAGLGHMLLAVGLVALFIALRGAVGQAQAQAQSQARVRSADAALEATPASTTPEATQR